MLLPALKAPVRRSVPPLKITDDEPPAVISMPGNRPAVDGAVMVVVVPSVCTVCVTGDPGVLLMIDEIVSDAFVSYWWISNSWFAGAVRFPAAIVELFAPTLGVTRMP